MKIKIEKSPIPIIWLDASVIIRMAKLKCGEKVSDIVDEVRYGSLYERLYRMVRDNKIICPKADQSEEIELGDRLVEECHEIQVSLSLGINILHRAAIADLQRQIVMKAYIGKEDVVVINYKDAFYDDPVITLQRKSPIIVSGFLKKPKVEISKRIQTKNETLDKLEELRKTIIENGISYEQQLEEEYKGTLQAGIYALENWIYKTKHGITPTAEDYSQLQIISMPLSEWDSYCGKPEGFEGLFQFISSEEYKLIPVVDISAKLWAKVTAGNSEIKSGDSMDINQLSAVIPYCDYVITDRKMKNRIIEIGLDQRYNTNIYSISDYSHILDLLDSL